MLPIILSFALTAPPLAAALASGESPGAARGVGFLRAELTARVDPPALRPGKRQVVGSLGQTRTVYTIDLQIGTPPQAITVAVDTGSPDTWVNPVCATAGSPGLMTACSNIKPFAWAASSTFRDLGLANQLTYGIGAALVEYVSDVLGVGTATIKPQIFGIAIQSRDLGYGILGLSPPLLGGTPPYSYVLDSMVQQKLIASRAFSLDLQAAGDKSGSIIFGGVDTKKFIGALAKVPIVTRPATPTGLDGYWVQLTGVGITTPDGVSHTSSIAPNPVLLDSGTTTITLPAAVVVAVSQLFSGAQYDPGSRTFLVDCANAGAPGTVDFTFGGKVIRVPYSELIWKGGDQCYLLIAVDNQNFPILGTPFLRSAYVVYDQDNNNIHLAQAANCGSNVIAIGTGTDAVPSSTGECTAQPSTT
ncbi:uncharacterized protein THITE_2022936, partial [Thermothielavioides terrestris NRRL 8126]